MMSGTFYNNVTSTIAKRNSKVLIDDKDSYVLIIYTGGTIGMQRSERGYIPSIKVFAEALRSNPMFHDASEHQFRLKHSHKPSPLSSPLLPDVLAVTHLSKQPYLEDWFITPRSGFNKRSIYRLLEMPVLLDSSNMQIENWIEIAEVIEKNYYCYDGFVVLHGTDTMAYTASILSFMLENLQKPVIITGAQIPYFEERSDAARNLLESLRLAGHFAIPEVCLYFNDKLFRGNRCTKINNSGFDSFKSPNCSYLAKLGISYKIRWDLIRHSRGKRLHVQKDLEQHISVLHFYPIITLESIKAVLREPIKAVVILSYGAGNIPSNRPDIIDELHSASSRGIIFLNITQCQIGSTSDDYEVGHVLTEIGVVFGCDMTLECALAKLSYLLGKFPGQPAIVREKLRESLRGELTPAESLQDLSISMQNVMNSIGNHLGVYDLKERESIAKQCLTMLTHNAGYEGRIEDLRKLTEDNVSLELRDHRGNSLLHVACYTGSLALVEFLLHRNVQVNFPDLAGNTPMMVAIQNGFVEIARRIRAKGGDMGNDVESIGKAMGTAAAKGDVEMLRIMIEAGGNGNSFDLQGRNAAHMAVIGNKIEAIRALSECEYFNWSCKDLLGFTPLDLAERLGFEEIAEFLKSIMSP